jgi:hypothetical protein
LKISKSFRRLLPELSYCRFGLSGVGKHGRRRNEPSEVNRRFQTGISSMTSITQSTSASEVVRPVLSLVAGFVRLLQTRSGPHRPVLGKPLPYGRGSATVALISQGLPSRDRQGAVFVSQESPNRLSTHRAGEPPGMSLGMPKWEYERGSAAWRGQHTRPFRLAGLSGAGAPDAG